MASEKRQNPTEIGEDDIGSRGKRHVVGEPLEKLDFVRAAVGSRNLTCHLDNFARFDGIDPARAKLAREHRKNTGARADFYNDGPLSNSLTQGMSISVHSNAIRDHRAITD